MPETRVNPRPKPQRSPPLPPSLMLVGGERLILPEGRVPRHAWPDVAFALLTEPLADELAAWMRRLEATLGVQDRHRQAMADRAVSAVEGSAEKRRRLLDQHRLAASLSRPMRDPSLVERIETKSRAAAAKRAIAAELRAESPKKHRRQIKVIEAAAAKLEREAEDIRLEELEQDRLYGEAKDSILRAKARGDDVDTREAQTAEFARDEWGARIIEDGLPALVYGRATKAKKLTGIDHAHDAGYLGRSWREAERLHKVGVDYREAYIVVEGEASGGGEGGGGGGPKAPQPRQIEMGQTLADMRRGLNRRQRDVLDLVCGQDLRLREATVQLGLGDPRTGERALSTGLVAAAESLTIERERRIEEGTDGDLGRHVQAVTAMLRRVRV